MTQYLSAAVYWRCQYLRADAQRVESEAKYAVARAVERYRDALRSAGLDPSVAYTWHDADYRVEATNATERS